MIYDHKTIQLASLFRVDSWENLSSQEKRDAIVELEKFSAHQMGHNACEVEFKDLNGFVGGYYHENRIIINSNVIDDDKYIVKYNDEYGVEHTKEYLVEYSGINIMNVVFHEDTHLDQDYVKGDPMLAGSVERARDMQAGGRVSTYIDPEVDYELYRIQPNEYEAFSRGIKETISLFSETNKIYGEDESFAQFVEENEHAQEMYLKSAAERYNEDNIYEALSSAIRDEYYHTNESQNYASAPYLKDALKASYNNAIKIGLADSQTERNEETSSYWNSITGGNSSCESSDYSQKIKKDFGISR